MSKLFLFNSPPRSGNVFFTFLFYFIVGLPGTKCLDIKKYSDKSQKQAVFFRNPYDSISSTIVKSRVDWCLSFNKEDIKEISTSIDHYAKEYLEAIKESKINFENIYTGKSEDAMKDPIGTMKDIAMFFDIKINNEILLTNEKITEQIKLIMYKTEKTRVDRLGVTVKENLMTDHDGHLPREKTKERLLLDSLIKEIDSNVVKECYNEYISIVSTNAAKGDRWAY